MIHPYVRHRGSYPFMILRAEEYRQGWESARQHEVHQGEKSENYEMIQKKWQNTIVNSVHWFPPMSGYEMVLLREKRLPISVDDI